MEDRGSWEESDSFPVVPLFDTLPMSEWIKVRKTLGRDGRILLASRQCGVCPATVLGGLIILWSLADDYASEDGKLTGYTPDDIDRETRIDGFCDSLPPDWIRIEGDEVFLPEYHEHNGETAKERAQHARRQAKSRNAKQNKSTGWKSRVSEAHNVVADALRTRHRIDANGENGEKVRHAK